MIRTHIANALDEKARDYGPRAFLLLSLGSIVWPLLPLGVAYAVGFGAATALSRMVRPC